MERDNKFEKNSFIVFLLTTFGSILNYLSQILMGRFLNLDEYGTINLLFSIILIFGIFGSTLSMIFSKSIASNKENIVSSILKKANIFLVTLTIISSICIMFFYKNNNFIFLILSTICVITSIYPLIFQGILGGFKKFILLGLYTLICPLIKICAILILLYLNFNNKLDIVISSIILGNIISIFVGYLFLKKNMVFDEKEEKYNVSGYIDVFVINILLMFMMNIDIIYLSLYVGKSEVGLYSSVLMFGKMVYYFVSALVTVMLPLVASNRDGKNKNKLLYTTLKYTIILSLLFLFPINIFGNKFLKIIFGSKFTSAVKYIRYASFISFAYSLNLIIVNFFTGIDKLKFLKNSFIVSSLIMILSLILFNNNKYLCLIMIGIINLIIFIVNIIYYKIKEGSILNMKKKKNEDIMQNKIGKEKFKLSVIVPCYNEGNKIYKNLLLLEKVLKKSINYFEIIAVNDGSKDNTKDEIKRASTKSKCIKLVSYDKNKGKGNALKYGTSLSDGDLVAFIDGDLELSPEYILKYIDLLYINNADVVIASKMHKDSIIKYPFRRKILSIGYFIILKILFRLGVKDTQTGLKVFKGNLIRLIMKNTETKGFSFDIEVLAMINRYGYKIIDAPINLNFTREHAMGRIKIKDILKMFCDTLKIFINLSILKKYDKKIRKELVNDKTLFYFIGTEAELMKMYHVIGESMDAGYKAIIVSNGQNDIQNSIYLDKINKKIDIDMTKYMPKKKGINYYLKWFLKTRRYGIKILKKRRRIYNYKNSLMVVHGDTMSTLMGSMIARRVKLRYIHVESGPRSYNWFSPFPEEIDRYFSSKYSIMNFCQNDEAAKLATKLFKAPAISTKVNTGIEILYDALDECKKLKLKRPLKDKYFLFAIHRQENLLNNTFMKNVIKEVLDISKDIRCVFIYHSQTKDTLEKLNLWNKVKNNKNITLFSRQDYVNFINIVKNSEFVIGDGCGNQQEFYYMGKPYLIMRTEVEENTEGLNWNALPFDNNFENIRYFYNNYQKFTKNMVKISKKPSEIIIENIKKICK